MRDYAELIKDVRYCCISGDCVFCNRKGRAENWRLCQDGLLNDAADAIEELLAAVRSVVRCKDCEWWTKQEASIQGRCARLAIYPTGEFYCASGSKREPPKGVE